MSSEDPARDRLTRVVHIQDASSVSRCPTSPLHDRISFDLPSQPMCADGPVDDWGQQNVDNILALLKANAELRALAVKLSDILVARGVWNGDGLDQAALASRAGNPRRG